MILSEVQFDGAVPIEGYGPGFFRVGGQVLQGPVVIWKDGARGWGGLDDIDTLLGLKRIVDVIFIGTGASIAPVPAPLRAAMDAAGIGVEPMGSASACRTYNVLLSEGRRVAAALLPL
jgi:uncharacterized protein